MLKNTLTENPITLAKLKAEVDKVYDFLQLMEDYKYKISNEVIENYWDLK